DLAYAALFHAWGLSYPGGDACREAARQGLRCRVARGGLDELRQLIGRPCWCCETVAARSFRLRSPASMTIAPRLRWVPKREECRSTPSRPDGRDTTRCSGACRRKRARTFGRESAGRLSRGLPDNSRRRKTAQWTRPRTRSSTTHSCAR